MPCHINVNSLAQRKVCVTSPKTIHIHLGSTDTEKVIFKKGIFLFQRYYLSFKDKGFYVLVPSYDEVPVVSTLEFWSLKPQ